MKWGIKWATCWLVNEWDDAVIHRRRLCFSTTRGRIVHTATWRCSDQEVQLTLKCKHIYVSTKTTYEFFFIIRDSFLTGNRWHVAVAQRRLHHRNQAEQKWGKCWHLKEAILRSNNYINEKEWTEIWYQGNTPVVQIIIYHVHYVDVNLMHHGCLISLRLIPSFKCFALLLCTSQAFLFENKKGILFDYT